MKRKWGLFCCVMISILLTGCQSVSDSNKEEQKTETVTEQVSDKETNDEESAADHQPAVGLGSVQAVPADNADEIQDVPTDNADEIPEVPVSQTEEYMQCPYCAHWFSTLPEGELQSQYDRHMQEERETDSAHGLTEAELAECPDCGNWYPTGNIFRNHICEGRQ